MKTHVQTLRDILNDLDRGDTERAKARIISEANHLERVGGMLRSALKTTGTYTNAHPLIERIADRISH